MMYIFQIYHHRNERFLSICHHSKWAGLSAREFEFRLYLEMNFFMKTYIQIKQTLLPSFIESHRDKKYRRLDTSDSIELTISPISNILSESFPSPSRSVRGDIYMEKQARYDITTVIEGYICVNKLLYYSQMRQVCLKILEWFVRYRSLH